MQDPQQNGAAATVDGAAAHKPVLPNGANGVKLPQSMGDPLLTPQVMVLDDVINGIGWGVWTAMYFLLVTLVTMSMVVNLLVSEFTAVEVDFTCTSYSNGTSSNFSTPAPFNESDWQEFTTNQTSSLSVYISAATVSATEWPEEGSLVEPTATEGNNAPALPSSQCYVNDSSGDGIVPCTTFQYDSSMFENTITTEFNLVCSKDHYRELFQLLFTIGCLVGAPVGGIVADKFGRRRSMWYGCLCLLALTVLLISVPILWVVLLSRFLMGLFTDIIFLASITLGMEVCPRSLRWLFASVESLPYAIMLPVLAGIAYLCRQWRSMQFWASMPLILATVVSCPLILDESPRWLVSKGKLEEAEKTIRRAARLNRNTEKLPPDWQQILPRQYKEQERSAAGGEVSLKAHLWSLVSTREMRTITIVITVMWLVEGTLYISLPLEASTYESPYLYMALLGSLELPGTFIITPLGGKLGRKKVGFVCAIITSTLLVVMACLKGINYQNEWLLVVIAVVAYVTLVGVSQMTILLTSELFPTTVRSLGSSIGFFMNNLGYCLPPLLEMCLPPNKPYILLGVYSIMALLNAFLLLFLPETSHRSLLETVSEHVQRERDKKKLQKQDAIENP